MPAGGGLASIENPAGCLAGRTQSPALADEAGDQTHTPACLLVAPPDIRFLLLPAALLLTVRLSVVDSGAAPVAALPIADLVALLKRYLRRVRR